MRNKYAFYGLILFCVACSSERTGLRELKRLCEKDAGLTIYKTVEAEGYYDAYTDCHHCWNELIRSDYRFVEFCAVEDREPLSYILPDKGCYRVSKVKRDQNACHLRVDQRLSEFKIDPFPEFLQEHCIAVEKIEKPEAEYTYLVERKEWWVDENTGTKMTWGAGRIVNTETKEVLGESINYVLYPKWYGSSRSKPSIHCGSYQITGKVKTMPFAKGLIEKTLIDGTEQDKGEMK